MVIKSTKGHAICDKCVYESLSIFDEIPAGAVYCFSCKSFEGFTVIYQNSKSLSKIKVDWSFAGLDNYNEVIYQIKATNSAYSKGFDVDRLYCGKCTTLLPKWMLEINRYVKVNIPTKNKS